MFYDHSALCRLPRPQALYRTPPPPGYIATGQVMWHVLAGCIFSGQYEHGALFKLGCARQLYKKRTLGDILRASGVHYKCPCQVSISGVHVRCQDSMSGGVRLVQIPVTTVFNR